jgi:hypothetical protein
MYSYGAGAYAGYPNYQQQPVAQQPQQQQVSFLVLDRLVLIFCSNLSLDFMQLNIQSWLICIGCHVSNDIIKGHV